MLTPEQRTRETYRFDSLRNFFQGMLDGGVTSTFLLTTAIRVFSAPNWLKACIASSEKAGYLLNIVTLPLSARMNFQRISQLCAIYFLFVGICWLGCACSSSLWIFALFAICANLSLTQQPTLMVEIYSTNYPSNVRGKYLSTGLFLTAIAGIAFSKLGGAWLDTDLNNYRNIFLVMAVAAIFCAITIVNIPGDPLKTTGSSKIFANFQLLWKDRLFGLMIISWTFLGLGNFMSIPIRIEYLANPAYGINASNKTVALITFIVPAISRLISLRFWGILFDKYHFIKVRILLNCCWIIGLFLYFMSKNLYIIGLGSAFIGMAMGAGILIWNLWITKLAPPNKVSAYMGVHTSISGIRSLISPAIGYIILTESSPHSVAWTSIIFTLISTLIFAFAIKNKRFNSTPI